MRCHKTKFPTVKLPIYLPKWQIWMQLSPKYPLIMSMNNEWPVLTALADLDIWAQLFKTNDVVS